MPVGEFMDRVSTSNEQVEGNLSTVFQSVRGSKQYWFLRRSEVLCIVREYGPPTLFLTLSCAEYDSLEIATYLRKVNDVSNSYPIGRLCTEGPVEKVFPQTSQFLQGRDPQWESTRYGRSPLLQGGVPGLWSTAQPHSAVDRRCPRGREGRRRCGTAVDPGEDHLPHTQASNPELHQLVTKYQYHKCTITVIVRNESVALSSPAAGSGFRDDESASMLSVDECMKLSHRKMYNLPRSPEEIRINNYNPLLLMLWKANMDLQYIGESSLAIAQYVTGYVTKAERSNMQDLWEEVSSHSSIYSTLWSFGIRSLRSRECGLYYEASDLLLGDHLCEKSMTVKWVNVSRPQNRKRRLRDHSN
jgi:hypothetical protein